jgi:hypothetical protein
MSNSSVQVRLDLAAIENGVACFGSGDRIEFCAALEIAGSQESLATVDDAKQEELLAAYGQFLNSLTFPFQLLVQVYPVDLSWYVSRVEDRARALPAALVAIARDHAAFVQGLVRQRTLLERHIYVVVSWSRPAEPGNTPIVLSHIRLRRKRHADVDERIRFDAVSRQLKDRCDSVARQLSRAGIRATRLDDLGLAHLYHVSWAPEIARTQRLRRELADYTALVVGAEPQFRRNPTRLRDPGTVPTGPRGAAHRAT